MIGSIGSSGQPAPGNFNGTPFFVATGPQSVNFYNVLGTELLWVEGPLSVQSEAMVNFVYQSGTTATLPGMYSQVGYFLTGETLERRGPIKPLRPFDLRPGKFGLGAWELQGRFSSLNMGQQVFTGGLADQNLWTNHLYTTDLGVSWYLNEYAKIYLDWEHAVFGDPVLYRPGGLQKTSDLFWLRFQVFF